MKNKVTTTMPQEKTTVSFEEFQYFFKHTPEAQSSSPIGLHLGHYKSATYSPDLTEILWKIALLALENKHPLQRWQTSVTVLLEKSAGNPFIHK